jgi:8-oxo-dGTP pyrophosphatase MutT (NUDIX family)
MGDHPDDIRLAATILLVRDGASGLEVFMVERHQQIDFATGALVFPGGKVEEADRDPALRARCRGAEQLDGDALAVRVAAIRETFEEGGVLVARPQGGEALVDAARLGEIEDRYREDLQAGRVGIGELVESEQLELACDRLVHFAHWITPEIMPKRFDTHFFLVPAPPDQVALHDGRESVDSLWTTIASAVDDAKAGRRTIIFPTMMNLRKLGQSASVKQALEAARSKPVVTVLPRVEQKEGGRPRLILPEEAGYDLSWARPGRRG